MGCRKQAVPEVRIKYMANYGGPKTNKQLRSFLGSIGYTIDNLLLSLLGSLPN